MNWRQKVPLKLTRAEWSMIVLSLIKAHDWEDWETGTAKMRAAAKRCDKLAVKIQDQLRAARNTPEA